MECLKSGLDIFLERSIQTSIVNSPTVKYKTIAQPTILLSWNLIAEDIAITIST